MYKASIECISVLHIHARSLLEIGFAIRLGRRHANAGLRECVLARVWHGKYLM